MAAEEISGSLGEAQSACTARPDSPTTGFREGQRLVVDLYNRSRPHMALGPGVPDPPPKTAVFPAPQSRHRIADGFVMLAKSMLGGLHHEYSLAPAVA